MLMSPFSGNHLHLLLFAPPARFFLLFLRQDAIAGPLVLFFLAYPRYMNESFFPLLLYDLTFKLTVKCVQFSLYEILFKCNYIFMSVELLCMYIMHPAIIKM